MGTVDLLDTVNNIKIPIVVQKCFMANFFFRLHVKCPKFLSDINLLKPKTYIMYNQL